MKKIYILLSRTGTIPSRIIHLFTRKNYTHASIALEPAHNGFYSYGRRNLHNIFIAGLIHEDLNGGVFALFPDANCELFSLDVDEKCYDKVKCMIDYYLNNYDKCTYKFGSVLPMYFGIKHKLKFKMTCSQFVATLLANSGACTLPRHPSLMFPSDFTDIPEMKSIYVGKVKSIEFPKEESIPKTSQLK